MGTIVGNWIIEPIDLFLYKWIESIPLLSFFVFGWEPPEQLCHRLHKNWISIVKNVHADNIEVEEIKENVKDLRLFEADANEICQS